MPYSIKPVAAADTRPLRQRILRPHQTVAEVGTAADDDPGAGHFAAIDEEGGEIVGVVTVHRELPPAAVRQAGGEGPDTDQWWRLRGMATAEQVRRQGVGRALIARVVEHARAHGGTHLWCNARLPAVGFYTAAGFRTAGEAWEEPAIGPHIAMWRHLD